jgi:transposase
MLERFSLVPAPLNLRSVPDAVLAFADRFVSGGVHGDQALLDLLMRRAPRLKGRAGGAAVRNPGESLTDAVIRAVMDLDNSYLFIQGPPGTGKTYNAAHAILALLRAGKRHGTLSLLAGIDLLTGKVHALVKERHRSREFIEFLKLLDAAYPASTAIKLLLDNHSAHISRETQAWLAAQPAGRFEFTFTPKHGSWLNLIEGFFSKFARSVLRHIRVASKQELKERIMAGIEDVNRYPVLHTWSYKLAEAA